MILNAFLIILCLCSCGINSSVPESNINDITVTESNINNTTSIVQEESTRDKLLNSIESDYKNDSQKEEYTTTAGMIDLEYIYAEKWDEVSAEYYNKIIAVAEDKFNDKKDVVAEKLDKLKTAYDEYAESSLDMNSEICNMRYAGGSIIGVLCAAKYCELRKEYALELVDIYEELTFDMSE